MRNPFYCCICLLIFAYPCLTVAAAPKPNILFIAVDDLRPELGCYGASIMMTPHIDKLATWGGTLFRRASLQ